MYRIQTEFPSLRGQNAVRPKQSTELFYRPPHMRFIYQTTAGFKKSDIDPIVQSLKPYQSRLKQIIQSRDMNQDESSLHLPFDEAGVKKITALTKKLCSRPLKFLVLVGIGGSNLGASAAYEALKRGTPPELLLLDTLSASALERCAATLQHCSSEDFLIVIVSKSGTTIETLVNAEILVHKLKPRFKNIFDRIVAITNEHSELWKLAEANHMVTLAIPKKVDGRFSVFSAVGLFSLAALGIDIRSLLKGAQKNIEKDALVSATISYLHTTQGRSIQNVFYFAPELEALGKWHRQLVAESLGKEGKGIAPIVSIGTTDLHSMAQLYFDGPKNIFTQFVIIESSKTIAIPKNHLFGSLLNLQHSDTHKLMQTIATAVQKAYRESQLPFSTIILEKITEQEIGAYLQFRMLETMYLAKLMGVNAFDQPAVEFYKRKIR